MYIQNDSNEEYVILEFKVHQKSSFSLTRLVILNFRPLQLTWSWVTQIIVIFRFLPKQNIRFMILF